MTSQRGEQGVERVIGLVDGEGRPRRVSVRRRRYVARRERPLTFSSTRGCVTGWLREARHMIQLLEESHTAIAQNPAQVALARMRSFHMLPNVDGVATVLISMLESRHRSPNSISTTHELAVNEVAFLQQSQIAHSIGSTLSFGVTAVLYENEQVPPTSRHRLTEEFCTQDLPIARSSLTRATNVMLTRCERYIIQGAQARTSSGGSLQAAAPETVSAGSMLGQSLAQTSDVLQPTSTPAALGTLTHDMREHFPGM